MSTFQTEYETTTNSIDTIVSTQLSSVLNWMNVPGSLVKASSSAAGFVWGYNAGNSLYMCQLPCTGNWTLVDYSKYQVSNILDLTTDDTNVYILYTNSAGVLSLLVGPATNQGTQTIVPVPFPAKEIFSTHTYIWAQDSLFTKQRCAKPCTMPNWQPSKDTTVQITSSDNFTLYGTDPTGEVLQTDETLQSQWQPIGNLKGSVFGKGADGTLYGIDSKQTPFQFKDKVESLFTEGLSPTKLTVDSASNQLWMTTETPGEAGNIFTRPQKPDYTTIMNNISPLDRTRDKIVDSVGSTFNRQTDVMTVNKQVDDIVTFFTKMFRIDGNTQKNAQAQTGELQDRIRETQNELDQMANIEPLLLNIILLLLLICFIYLFLSPLLGTYIHILALIVFGGGMFVATNFSIPLK